MTDVITTAVLLWASTLAAGPRLKADLYLSVGFLSCCCWDKNLRQRLWRLHTLLANHILSTSRVHAEHCRYSYTLRQCAAAQLQSKPISVLEHSQTDHPHDLQGLRRCQHVCRSHTVYYRYDDISITGQRLPDRQWALLTLHLRVSDGFTAASLYKTTLYLAPCCVENVRLYSNIHLRQLTLLSTLAASSSWIATKTIQWYNDTDKEKVTKIARQNRS